MTELETMQRAKMYMDKLANGINPLDNSTIPDTDIVNNVRLSRCFFYVSDVLRRMIAQEQALARKKTQKAPFSMPMVIRDKFEFSDSPIPVSEITRRLNAHVDKETMNLLNYQHVITWLVESDLLYFIPNDGGKLIKRPTPNGEMLGISIETRTRPQGSYDVILYNKNAQKLILDNLDSIICCSSKPKERAELQGKPWFPAHDDCLIDLYQKGVSVSEIAETLKRSTSAVRSRIKRLGLETGNT